MAGHGRSLAPWRCDPQQNTMMSGVWTHAVRQRASPDADNCQRGLVTVDVHHVIGVDGACMVVKPSRAKDLLVPAS